MFGLITELISVFWITLEAIATMTLCSAFLKYKRNRVQILLGHLLTVLLTKLCCMLAADVPRIILCMAVYLIIMHWLFEGKILSHAVILSIGYMIVTLLDVFFINGFCYLIKTPYNELIWFKRTYVLLVTVEKLLAILLAWIVRYIRMPRDWGHVSNTWLALTLMFPATSLIMFYMLFINVNKNEDISIGIIIAATFLSAANIALLYIITALEKATNHERDLRLLKQQMQLQTDNMKAMELNYRTQRRVTHEFERHLQTIQNLLSNQEYETLQNYVGKLRKDRALRIVSVNSHHPVIDAILNQKHQLAQESGIKMQIELSDLSEVSVQTDKLVVLLSNLMDNAIEACLRLENNREIHCRIVKEEGLYISIRNTSLPVEIRDGVIASSKPGFAQHGYGLQAVRYVLAELNAEYTFVWENGWFRFAAEIP